MCLKMIFQNGCSNRVKIYLLMVVNGFHCVFNALECVFGNFECVLNWFQVSLKWVSMNCKGLGWNDFTTVLDINFVACLRRGDFRYTAILSKAIPDHFFFAFGEAILGTQRYFSKQFKFHLLKELQGLTHFLIFPPPPSA